MYSNKTTIGAGNRGFNKANVGKRMVGNSQFLIILPEPEAPPQTGSDHTNVLRSNFGPYRIGPQL